MTESGDNSRPNLPRALQGRDMGVSSSPEDDGTIVSAVPAAASGDMGEASDSPELSPEEMAERRRLPTRVGQDRVPVGVGYVINRNYEITEVIKSGGMGQVFRGRTIGNEVPVAIKTVLPEHEQVQAVNDLFKKESNILVRLNVDGIVRYFNYIYDEDNRRGFLIMEFIDGLSLSEYLEINGRLSLKQTVNLFRRVASALARAHREDIVHRDLSPDNVMLRDSDIEDAVLIDFGIAKATNINSDVTVGVGAGKYKYMAPEQLGMFKSRIGPWTDVYGLGLLMVAASTGTPLDMGSNPSEAVDARRAELDLSAVPDSLEPLVREMLSVDPVDRPASMKEVLERLPDASGVVTGAAMASVAPAATPVTGVRGVTDRNTVPGLRMRPDVTTTLATGTAKSTDPDRPTRRPAPVVSERRRSGLLWPLVALVAMGGLGYLGYSQFLAVPPADVPEGPGASPAPAIERLFATADLGSCAYGKLGTDPESTGRVELFSRGETDGAALLDRLDREQNMVTSIVPRPVTEAQCPVVALVRTLQARSAVPVELNLDIRDGGDGGLVTLSGTVSDSLARDVTLAFVLPNGRVERISAAQLATVPEGRRFSVQYRVFVRGNPVLVVAIATAEPIARLGANVERDATEFAEIVAEALADPAVADRSAGRLGYVFLP